MADGVKTGGAVGKGSTGKTAPAATKKVKGPASYVIRNEDGAFFNLVDNALGKALVNWTPAKAEAMKFSRKEDAERMVTLVNARLLPADIFRELKVVSGGK